MGLKRIATLKSRPTIYRIAMSEKLAKADDLCSELAETLSQNPDTVEITVTIPDSGDSSTTTVTDKEITLMAESGLFGLDGGIQARIERE